MLENLGRNPASVPRVEAGGPFPPSCPKQKARRVHGFAHGNSDGQNESSAPGRRDARHCHPAGKIAVAFCGQVRGQTISMTHTLQATLKTLTLRSGTNATFPALFAA